jgi:O-antigen ligase
LKNINSFQISTPQQYIVFICLTFLVTLLIASTQPDVPLERSLFGQFGRGGGLIYYFLAICSLFLGSILWNPIESKLLYKHLYIFSLILSMYAFFQKIGIDFAKLDSKGLSPVVLTLGNSNFAGGLLAVLFVFQIVYSVTAKTYNLKSLFLLSMLFLATILTEALQGIIIIVLGIFFAINFYLFEKFESRKSKILLKTSWIVIFVSTVLGVFGKFVFAPIFERRTFQLRLEYWKITLEIIRDHLFFGVGPDRMGDVSSLYMAPGRLEIITATRMDTGHNWFLTLAASYGLPSLCVLLVLIISIITMGVKCLNKSSNATPAEIASYFSFLALVLDGLVSIEQPGLGIWLYFFAGINISVILSNKTKTLVTAHSNSKPPKALTLILTVVIVLGSASVVVSTNRFVGDAQIRNSIQKIFSGKGTNADVESVMNQARRLRAEPEYTTQALDVFSKLGDANALDQITKVTYEYFPSSMQAALMRAEVLRVLDRERESCPIRFRLIHLTPWDTSQVMKYFDCLAQGEIDSNLKGSLSQIDLYRFKNFPLNGSSNFQLLKNYSVTAFFEFLVNRKDLSIPNLTQASILLRALEKENFSTTLGPSDLADYVTCKNIIKKIESQGT